VEYEVVFEKEYIMQCSSAEWTARNGCWRLYKLFENE